MRPACLTVNHALQFSRARPYCPPARAVRHGGELLRDGPKATGTRGQLQGRDPSGGAKAEPPEAPAPTLAEMGIDKKQAERAEQVARWIDLVEQKQQAEALARADARNVERESDYKVDAEGVSPQLGEKPEGGRPEGGVKAARKELGVSKGQAYRSKLIASIPDEAKQAAKDAGLAFKLRAAAT